MSRQCLTDKFFAKDNEVMDNKESDDFEMLNRNEESTSQGATDENTNDVVLNEKDGSKNQVVGTSLETTSGDDNLSVPC